ncbi:glycosyltransferase family 4 protein [Sporomusa sp.]|uniref:glycosyltransferase family 4 protein n=1 Tax=Sporomusa sp. TaxID=2078658 RepID=UPI002C09DAE4|nr:glycosyltransferase family 4 protein [Sporomusa sp.]HWR44302.1 glycosyltransferase family 4 protein [Sporomusa sp.]
MTITTVKRKLSIIEMISISKEWGGIEQHVRDVSQSLTANGHKVNIVTRPVELLVQEFSKVCPVNVLPIRSAIDIETIWKLAGLIKKEQVDIIHTHTSRDSWLAVFAVRLAGRGKVVTTRHMPFPAKTDAIHISLFRRISAVICVSNFVKQRFLANKPALDLNKVQVVYPGIDIERFSTCQTVDIRAQLNLTPSEFVVGFAGRLTKEKGVHVLIEAIAKINNQGKYCRLLVAGGVNPNTPDYLNQLRSQADNLGISHLVDFYGFTTDIVSVMRSINVLVLPSVIPETFGLVLAEAMLAGRPAISTRTGAQQEVIQDEQTGFIIPPESVDALAEAIIRLIDNPKQAEDMGNSGREYVISHFSKNAMRDNLEDVFLQLL